MRYHRRPVVGLHLRGFFAPFRSDVNRACAPFCDSAPTSRFLRGAAGSSPRRQLRRISQAILPELRSIEGLGVIIAVFLVAFSSTYLGMSHQAATTFTKSLDHVQALYFTISVFSTVGFGDITPRTDVARLVVSAQMLLDLVVIGAVVRIIFNATRNRVDAPSTTEV